MAVSLTRFMNPFGSPTVSTFNRVLNTGKTREIVSGTNRPLFIFTDASFEPADSEWPAGIGGVIYNEFGEAVEHFSYCLRTPDLERLGFPKHKQTVIFETEVLAVIVALRVWRNKIADRPVVIFVDNNNARDVAISTSARTKEPLLLVSALLVLEDEIPVFPWYARVPSKSNPADEPSRALESLGSRTPHIEIEGAVRSILARIA